MCVFFDEIFNVDKKTFPIFETHEIYDTKMVKITKKLSKIDFSKPVSIWS